VLGVQRPECRAHGAGVAGQAALAARRLVVSA
jgi:hypothetical protein